MAKTLREKFTEALQRKGCLQVKAASRKYLIFIRDGGNGYYYVGKSGSLRMGSTIAGSVPVSARFKAELLAMVQQ
jgi:hypothetical protein